VSDTPFVMMPDSARGWRRHNVRLMERDPTGREFRHRRPAPTLPADAAAR